MCKLEPSTKGSDEAISNIESFNYSSIEDECLLSSFAGEQHAGRYGGANREISDFTCFGVAVSKERKFSQHRHPVCRETKVKSSQNKLNIMSCHFRLTTQSRTTLT